MLNISGKIRLRKKKNELIKMYPTSNVSFNATTNGTKLAGYNVVGSKTNVSDSEIGVCTIIGKNGKIRNSKIGKFCSISNNVIIQPCTHPINFVSTYPGFFNTVNEFPFGKGTANFNEFIKTENGYYCEIGNDVWIGQNVIIKGGVVIGDGAIIGMGSVVTKDVAPYSIVGGVPAKLIKNRFENRIVDALLRIKWWDWDIELIENRRDEFVDINSFVDKYDIEK